jgi:hypothetical protein
MGPAPVPAMVQVVSKTKQPKVPLPEYFDGNRSKLKPFLAQAELYIGFNIDLYPGEDRKVLWVTTLFRGAAFSWIETYLNDYLEDPNSPEERGDMANKIFGSFKNFKAEINKVFGDVDALRTAERTIQNLKQVGFRSRILRTGAGAGAGKDC